MDEYIGNEDSAVTVPKDCFWGMAAMLCMIRDLFTITPLETFSREQVLVLLHTLATDPETFPDNEGLRMWEED